MLILDLPVDVVLNVFRFIDVDDIFRLREVSNIVIDMSCKV